MLVIDVSQSMRATDVSPNRLAAAQEAAKQFADELTPGINLGLISYAGTATVLVSPTTNRDATKAAIDKLQLADRTATGEGIFTALQAIATVGAVIGGGDEPPPARIVLFSDGKETVPSNPDNPKGAYTAARTAKDQGVPISTISFGTPYGYVEINDQRQPVPVDDEMLKKIADLSGGDAFTASSLEQLTRGISPTCSSRSATRPSRATPVWAGCGSARWCWRWRPWRRCSSTAACRTDAMGKDDDLHMTITATRAGVAHGIPTHLVALPVPRRRARTGRVVRLRPGRSAQADSAVRQHRVARQRGAEAAVAMAARCRRCCS